MKKALVQFFGITAVTLLLLAFVETACRYLLPAEQRRAFFIDLPKNNSNSYEELNGVGFDEIDPLTGWSMSDSLLHQKGFTTQGKNVVLQTKYSEGKALVIYISGGSTTDVATIAQNWPIELIALMDSHAINTKIIMGSVGGYNSGQELLKLLAYDNAVSPDIHLSYSGANEVEPEFVSTMEQKFYTQAATVHSPFLPNAVQWFRNKTGLNQAASNAHIIDYYGQAKTFYQAEDETAYVQLVKQFWSNNMQSMNALAQYHHYAFIGILQPVLGGGTYTQTLPQTWAQDMVADYKKYYPALAQVCAEHPDFLVDYKNVFDGTPHEVYLDDCHIKPAYQKVIAQKIYDLLVQKKLIPNSLR